MQEIDITLVHKEDSDVKLNPKMAEIRFDCSVRMYDCGIRTAKVPYAIPFMYEEKPLPPQWFRSYSKITLESIKHADPYDLGMQLKNMYAQLEHHIKKYESGQL